MSLERRRLQALVDNQDLDGICDWVDNVVQFAKAEALRTNGLERIVELEACAQGLFALLDHVDTLSDQIRPDMSLGGGHWPEYYAAVNRAQRQRFAFGSTDGYSVKIHQPRDPNAPPEVNPAHDPDVWPRTIWERLAATE